MGPPVPVSQLWIWLVTATVAALVVVVTLCALAIWTVAQRNGALVLEPGDVVCKPLAKNLGVMRCAKVKGIR